MRAIISYRSILRLRFQSRSGLEDRHAVYNRRRIARCDIRNGELFLDLTDRETGDLVHTRVKHLSRPRVAQNLDFSDCEDHMAVEVDSNMKCTVTRMPPDVLERFANPPKKRRKKAG